MSAARLLRLLRARKRSGARSMDNLEEKESTGKRVPTSVTDLRAARESRANEVGGLLVKLLNVGIFGLGRGCAEGSKSSNQPTYGGLTIYFCAWKLVAVES